MRRRQFLEAVTAGGGLASLATLAPGGFLATAQAQAPTRSGPARPAVRRAPIIDVHLHAYPADGALAATLLNPVTGKPPGVADGAAHMRACLGEMQRLNIVTGIVSGGDGDRLAAAAAWREAAPDRILAGAGVRGSTEIPLPPIGVLREAFSQKRLHVLGEVTAQYAGLSLSDAVYQPYLALAEELDVPVAVHMGIGPPGISQDACCRGFRVALGNPTVLEEALNRHPKLRLNLMHGGWPYLQETIALLMVYPQVYTDLGAIDWLLPRAEFHAYLHALVRAGLGTRILFGSDQMYCPEAIGLAVEAIDSASFLTPAQRRDIFYGNAARFLRLERA
ncbi:MAG: amidohydrolase family protein [Vicinamibacteraceae bacterium]